MSLARIILTIIIVTYGTNAAFWYDKTSNKYSVSADDDINESDSIEDFFGENYDSENVNNAFSDYAEDTYDHENEILERQLPESGEMKIKKGQTWCKVKRVTKQHFERGYEFFPKNYSEYDCVPYIRSQSSVENGFYSHDVCLVKDVTCKPLQRTLVYFKRHSKIPCLLKKEEKIVNVGCSCINHVKYHIH